MARFRNVLDYLGLDNAEGRKECPLCGSSDGLHVTLESTREGEVHCYSCGQPTPGTGIELYRRQEGVSKAEAMETFGIEVEGRAESEKKAEEAQDEWRRRAEESQIQPDDYLLEIERLKLYMTPSEWVEWKVMCKSGGRYVRYHPPTSDDSDSYPLRPLKKTYVRERRDGVKEVIRERQDEILSACAERARVESEEVEFLESNTEHLR